MSDCKPGAWGGPGCLAHEGFDIGPDGLCDEGRGDALRHLVEVKRKVSVVDGIAHVETTYQARGYVRSFRVRAHIRPGSLVCLDPNGYAVPGRDEEREPVQRATQEQIERSRRSTLPAPPEDE